MHSFIKRLELFFFILFMFVFNSLGFFELIKTCSIYLEQISLKYRVLNLKLVAKWLCSVLILRLFNVKKSNLHFFFKWGKYLIIFWIFFHLSFQLKKRLMSHKRSLGSFLIWSQPANSEMRKLLSCIFCVFKTKFFVSKWIMVLIHFLYYRVSVRENNGCSMTRAFLNWII